jgi:hypothetical protein
MITIQPNKHIGLLFQPRSGSHVLRGYLSDLANLADLGELFNHTGSKQSRFRVANSTASTATLHSTMDPTELASIDRYARSLGNLEVLNTLHEKDIHAVFSVLLRSFSDEFPQLVTKLASNPDIQFIRLERADVLYSIISVMLAIKSEIWHNSSASYLERPHTSEDLSLPALNSMLIDYINGYRDIENNFSAPIIYYEQFQHRVTNILNLVDGVPKVIHPARVNKISGNYKESIENLSEVEDFYEQFVNDHKEYFPQYFGKLPHIQIPACQGRQPRDLSIKLAC